MLLSSVSYAQFSLDVTVRVDSPLGLSIMASGGLDRDRLGLGPSLLSRLFMPVGHAKRYFKEFVMSDRFPVTKFSSARSFERTAGHTRSINYITPLRGGWRL